ncbi:MAG: hypothetical protein JWR20_1497 [Marmoricola sp.]|nr:hypothetical protein [Marmoricola sp.]
MAELRIGDADREAAVADLGEHYAQGRLTKEEYDERADAVWSARTRSDLAPLFADLPGSAYAGAQRGTVPPLDRSWVPTSRPGPRSGRLPATTGVPWTAVKVAMAALLVLTVVTHLPFILLAGALWFWLSRRGTTPRPPWSHPR